MSSARSHPQLSLGLPVYNGERYLPCVLECIRSQAFEDYELIISDNASTDRTEEICREHAARDHRVRYLRFSENLGAARNYNRVFEESSSPYFKWVADDDTMAPVFIQRCMETLQSTPDAVIAYALARHIDAAGVPIGAGPCSPLRHYDWRPTATGRFRQLLEAFRVDGGASAPMFWCGVIRSEALRRTRMMGGYFASDLVLLAELILMGRFVEVPECLLSIRLHPGASSWPESWSKESIHQHLDPKVRGNARLTLEMRRYYLEYMMAVAHAPLSISDRARLWAYCTALVAGKLWQKVGARKEGRRA